MTFTDVYFTPFPTVGPGATVLGPEWGLYNSPGHAGTGLRRPSAIAVVTDPSTTTGRSLQITATNGTGPDAGFIVSGGMALTLAPQTYGQTEIRVRASADPQGIMSMVCILWPDSNLWPQDGELDFWESGTTPTRTPMQAFTHRLLPGSSSTDEQLWHPYTGIDGTQWHKVVFDWTPTELRVVIDNDGNNAHILTTDPAWIPDWPMHLTLQLDAFPLIPGVQPVLNPGNTPTMNVEYVVIRSYAAPPPPPALQPRFPQRTLDNFVEVALNPGPSPLTWVWTDLSNRVLAQTLRVTRGQADETNHAQSASLQIELDNLDGALTPNNPMSGYWPYFRRGVPFRVSTEGQTPALVLTGVNPGYASTPVHASLTFTGDTDVRILIDPEMWSAGLDWVDGALALTRGQRLISRWDLPSSLSWALSMWSGGRISFEWSTTGSGAAWFYQTAFVVAEIRPTWIAATLDVDNGAGGHVVTIYKAPGDIPPPADVTTWTMVRRFIITGTTTVFAGSAPVRIGSLAGFGSSRMRVLKAQIRNGINGTLVANPDFTAQIPGTTGFTDSTGRPWSVAGTASVSTRRIRFVGSIDEITLSWPYGDHNAPGTQPSESRVTVVASDVVRRLSQGPKSLASTLRRHITSAQHVAHILAYWPCEGEPGASYLAGGTPDSGPMTITSKIDVGADSSFLASAPLPKAKGGEEVSWYGFVPPGSAAHWAVEWFFLIPTPLVGATWVPIVTVQCGGGSTHHWTVSLNATNVLLSVYGTDQVTPIYTSSTASRLSGDWVGFRLEAQQNGGNIDWLWSSYVIDAGILGGVSGSFAGTLGPVTMVSSSLVVPPDGMSFGHITVSDGTLPGDWMRRADTAWVGESAAHRIFRLCAEEGVPVEVIGDPSVLVSDRGPLSYSQAMGPQRQLPLLSLLNDCAEVDQGILVSRRQSPGFRYRCRYTMDNQPVRMTIDCSVPGVTIPLVPTLDDQRLRNDVTVTSATGSSAQVANATSIADEGRYDASYTIGGVGGVTVQTAILTNQPGLVEAVNDQNQQHAGWLVHRGTWPELRYPTIRLDLSVAPQLIETWLGIELGDRINLANLPAQHPSPNVDLIIEGITELLSPTRWLVELTCGPGGAWQMGVLDA